MSLALFVGVALVAAATAADEVFDNFAFTAGFLDDTDVPDRSVLKYPQVVTNHGAGYDVATGVFTSPKGGLYVFHIHGQPTPGNDFSITLYQNNNPIIIAAGKQQGDNVGTGSNSVTLRLKKNDRVYVKANINSSLRGSGDRVYNTFTGYLVGVLTSNELDA